MQKKLDTPLWTALVTPFDHHSLIDIMTMNTLMDQQENNDCGILLLGSTGESLSLPLDEKKRLLEQILQKNRKVPIMVGVGGHNLQEQLQWIRFCKRYKIDAFLLLTPIYTKPGTKGQKKWFEQLLNEAEAPCMIYNHPFRCGTPLSLEACKELKDHPNFWAVKDASSSLETFREFRNALPGKLLYSGCDDMMTVLGPEGAHGIVSVMGNIWPIATKQFIEEAKSNKKSPLYPMFERGAAIANVLNPISAKKLLFTKGITPNELLLLPLSPEDVKLPTDWEEIDQALTNPQLEAITWG